MKKILSNLLLSLLILITVQSQATEFYYRICMVVKDPAMQKHLPQTFTFAIVDRNNVEAFGQQQLTLKIPATTKLSNSSSGEKYCTAPFIWNTTSSYCPGNIFKPGNATKNEPGWVGFNIYKSTLTPSNLISSAEYLKTKPQPAVELYTHESEGPTGNLFRFRAQITLLGVNPLPDGGMNWILMRIGKRNNGRNCSDDTPDNYDLNLPLTDAWIKKN
jgi:hypothetical protein